MQKYLTNLFNQRVLPVGSFMRNVTILAGGTALSQVLIILISPILTRLYSPSDFGISAVYTSLLSIVVVFASLRYEFAILIPKDDEDAANLLVLSTICVVMVSLLSVLGVFILKNQIACWMNTPVLGSYLWVLPCSIFGAGLYNALSYWAIRKKHFAVIAKTKLSQSIGKIIIQCILGFFKTGALGLIFGDLVGQVNGSGTFIRLVNKKDNHFFQQISFKGIKSVLKRFKKFPLISSWSAILNTLGLQIPLFFLTAFGNTVVGFFAFSQRILGMPLTLVSQSVAQVFMHKASQLAQNRDIQLLTFFRKLTIRLFILGFVPSIILFFFAPQIFLYVFGKQWLIAGVYTRTLIPVLLAQFVFASVGQIFNILEYQDFQLKWDIIRLICMSMTLYFSIQNSDPIFALKMYSGVLTLLYIGLYFSYERAIKKYCIQNQQQETT